MSRRYIGSLIDAFNTLKVANAPTIGTPTAGSCGTASVAFTAPSCVGGGAITSYTAVSCPGFKTGTGTTSPISVSCLTNCTSYTFKVNATNAYGPSAFSASSSSVTPFKAFGIFALGNSTTTTNKYTFSTCTSAVATCLALTIQNIRVGVGNSTKAVVGNNRWFFSGCTVSSGGGVSGANYGSAAGNSTVGIFAYGGTSQPPSSGGCFPVSSARGKYTYASCSISSATNASTYNFVGSAAGTCAFGIFALGAPCFFGGSSACREKYTYSSNTNAVAASASSPSYGGAAVGNATIGIFALGFACGLSTTRNKYTYSSGTSGSATSSTVGAYYGAATGSATIGIFQLGNCGSGGSTTRNRYVYSGDVNSSATASSANVGSGVTGFSTAISGVNF